jgi:hypothetical protein
MKKCDDGLEETETCSHTAVLMVVYVVFRRAITILSRDMTKLIVNALIKYRT